MCTGMLLTVHRNSSFTWDGTVLCRQGISLAKKITREVVKVLLFSSSVHYSLLKQPFLQESFPHLLSPPKLEKYSWRFLSVWGFGSRSCWLLFGCCCMILWILVQLLVEDCNCEFHFVKAWTGSCLFQLPHLSAHRNLLLDLNSPFIQQSQSYPTDCS